MANVSTPSDFYLANIEDWQTVSDLLSGTKAMREGGIKYAPKRTKEPDDLYQERLQNTYLFDAYGGTVKELSGLPFKKPVTFSQLDHHPEWLDNIDLAGNNANVFTQSVLLAAENYGLTHVLTEYNSVITGKQLSKEEEKKLGLRPYLVHIKPTQLIGADYDCSGGAVILHNIRIEEFAKEKEGQWGSNNVKQIRVIYPDHYEVYRQNKNKSEWVLHSEGPRTIGRLTLHTLYTHRTGFLQGKPKFMSIAEKNIEHWASSSKQRAIIDAVRIPILTGYGVAPTGKNDKGEDVVEISTDSLVLFDSDDGFLKWVEHTAKCVEAGWKDLELIEQHIQAMGGDVMARSTRSTATEVDSDNSKRNSPLHNDIAACENVMKRAIHDMGEWVNEKLDAEVSIWHDFGVVNKNPVKFDELLKLRQAREIDFESFIQECQRNGYLSENLSAEDILGRLNEEEPIFS